ncbi:MAG: hypothetical protein HOI35_11960 [Woeseia sp.]|nr:hypothetical protein [Woeseia sp.]MBT6210721.1 hypothetical protein [Woeseia sp.]
MLPALAGSLPCFSLAFTLSKVWCDPNSAEEGRWVKFGVGILLMEFLIIHSGGALAGIGQSRGWKDGLALVFYIPIAILMAWMIAYSMKSKSLFWSFMFIFAGRVSVLFLDQSGEALAFIIERTRVSALIYMPLVFLTITTLIPKWGMTDPKYAEMMQSNGSSGVWVEYPHRAIGAATIYFFLLGIAEIGYLSWVSLGA